jgi:transcriptional regulator of heat shock response
MMLSVTDEEARELAGVLDAKLREMRLELARTDDRAYRSDLRDQYEHLDRLRQRLAQVVTDADVYYP